MNTLFTPLISQLLKLYEIKTADTDCDSDQTVYTITVDNKTSIHLIGEQKDYLNIVCYLPPLEPPIQAAHLHSLLSLNDFNLDHPRFCLGLAENHAPVLSVRQPLFELNANDLYVLMKLFIERVELLQTWLVETSGKHTHPQPASPIKSNQEINNIPISRTTSKA